MVAFAPPDIVARRLEEVVGKTKTVPLDFDLLRRRGRSASRSATDVSRSWTAIVRSSRYVDGRDDHHR